MFYCLYKIKNKINDKIYVGVHKTKNLDDEYMGSGEYLSNAIKKHGIENFTKTILEIFSSNEEMYAREKEIVNETFLLRKDVYNIRVGGLGGFDHINGNPELRAKTSKAASEYNKANGIGGTKSWTNESWEKVNYQGWDQRIARGEFNPNTWAKLPLERQEALKQLHSVNNSGAKNASFGTHIYIDEKFVGKLPATTELNKQRYKPGEQPEGWITVAAWCDNKKIKNSPNYGRHWYNDSKENYYCYDSDTRIKELQLNRGRLNCKYKKNSQHLTEM